MSAGQRANIIRARLRSITKDIEAELTKLLAEGSTPLQYESAAIELQKKITSWASQLNSISKQLQDLQKSLESEGAQVRRLRREYKFSRMQSLRDRQRHVKGVQEDVVKIARLLKTLSDTSPTVLDFINRMEEILENGVDFFKDLNELEGKLAKANMREATTAVIEARGSMIRQSKPTTPGTGDYIVALVLLLRLFQMYALEKYRQKN